jgi:hypothetical protein
MNISIAMQTEHQATSAEIGHPSVSTSQIQADQIHLPSVPNTLLALAICTIGMGKHHLGGCQPHRRRMASSESPMQHADATIAGAGGSAVCTANCLSPRTLLSNEMSRCSLLNTLGKDIMNISSVAMPIDTLFNSLGNQGYHEYSASPCKLNTNSS